LKYSIKQTVPILVSITKPIKLTDKKLLERTAIKYQQRI
jgi:hypothetical protein